MIRAVLDTNVIVASLAAPYGPLAELADQWLSGRFDVVTSEHIIAEARQTWDKPYWRSRVNPKSARRLLSLLRRRADVVPVTVIVSGVAAHWQDDLVIATALSGNASVIVTGDREFLRVWQYEGVEIISPQQFLTRLAETGVS